MGRRKKREEEEEGEEGKGKEEEEDGILRGNCKGRPNAGCWGRSQGHLITIATSRTN